MAASARGRLSVMVSLCGRSASSQLRNFVGCTNNFKRLETEDVKASDGGKEFPSGLKETNPLQIDQQLIDVLYENWKEEDVKNSSKSANQPPNRKEYFNQVWQRKLNSMTQNEMMRNVSEELPSFKKADTDDGDDNDAENNFGTLPVLKNMSQGMSKIEDHRDPNERMAEEYPDDKNERDWRRNIPLTRYGRLGRKAFYYTKKMTKLGREGKIKEAIQVFDDWMMIQDRVMPSKRTFITLIGIVGRAGYTRKAFQLFRQMKHLGLDPPDQVYTSLFNACANCPIPDYGLKHANALYQQMQVKGIPPGPITVMASMKAFALSGDFPKAFQILDEARIPLDVQCFNSLLMACAMDRQTGFRRALKVWQMMRESNILPTQQTYNLLVRCVRDCGVGDKKTLASDLGLGQKQEEITTVNFFEITESNDASQTSGLLLSDKQGIIPELSKHKRNNESMSEMKGDDTPQCLQVLEAIPSLEDWPLPDGSGNKNENFVQHNKLAHDDDKSHFEETSMTSHEKEWWEHLDDSLPASDWNWQQNNSLDPVYHDDHFDYKTNFQMRNMPEYKNTGSDFTFAKSIRLSDLNSKPGRLAVIGGVTAIVSHMQYHGIQADIKTFTGLLSCVQNNTESEAMVLRIMEEMGVSPDIDFLNDVMMRRNMRHQSHSVREVLVQVSKLQLMPNMRTYAAIALTCHQLRDAENLLEDMRAANVEPTVEVMGHLIYISRLNFVYKRCLVEMMEELGLTPSPRIISMMEKSIAIAKRHIANAEKSADLASIYLSPKFQRQFKEFLKFYQSWLRRTELDEQEHPWDKFSKTDTKEIAT